MNKFFGTGVALITPFDKGGNVDFEGLGRLIEHQIQGGVEYMVSLGTTGESATLSKNEKKAVWEFTTETVAGRIPLVAGIGGNNTAEVVETVRTFSLRGYDAILSVSPYYNRPTQEGIYHHYKAIAQASALPVILYNVPTRTGSNMTADTTLKLAHEVENLIGIKEAASDFDQFNVILRDKPKDFLFISGDDAVSLPLIAMGAVGTISVIGNAIPRLFSDMIRLCLAGKFEEAKPLHYRMLHFTDLIFAEGNPGGIKEALMHAGICGNNLRLPLVNVSKALSDKLKVALESI